jgi:hypothetical protein
MKEDLSFEGALLEFPDSRTIGKAEYVKRLQAMLFYQKNPPEGKISPRNPNYRIAFYTNNFLTNLFNELDLLRNDKGLLNQQQKIMVESFMAEIQNFSHTTRIREGESFEAVRQERIKQIPVIEGIIHEALQFLGADIKIGINQEENSYGKNYRAAA